MLLIPQITADAFQQQNLLLPDGTNIFLQLYFRPQQQGWFVTELTYLEFTLRNLRICNSPNMLHPFRNKLPFGLACFSAGNREPSLQEDFSSGASKLYLLTAEEVAEFTAFLSGA